MVSSTSSLLDEIPIFLDGKDVCLKALYDWKSSPWSTSTHRLYAISILSQKDQLPYMPVGEVLVGPFFLSLADSINSP